MRYFAAYTLNHEAAKARNACRYVFFGAPAACTFRRAHTFNKTRFAAALWLHGRFKIAGTYYFGTAFLAREKQSAAAIARPGAACCKRNPI